VGQELIETSYFFIPLVLVPLNSLAWYVPSSRYTRGLGWRIHCGVEVTESSANKQHDHLKLFYKGMKTPFLSMKQTQRYEKQSKGMKQISKV
jgi:hypothetical protein